MAENKQLDARQIKHADLPSCPMGCERVYLNLVNKQPLDGNYSPHNVDFVHCTKCDFQAPIENWMALPGIYSQGIVGNISEQDLVNARDVILDLVQDFFAGEIPVMEEEACTRVELVFETLAASAEKQAARTTQVDKVPDGKGLNIPSGPASDGLGTTVVNPAKTHQQLSALIGTLHHKGLIDIEDVKIIMGKKEG